MKKLLTATTEHGTFTRNTEREYKYVAVTKAEVNGKFYANWSATIQGAQSLLVSNSSAFSAVIAVGVYPVDGTQGQAAEPKAPATPRAPRRSFQAKTLSQIQAERQAFRSRQMDWARKMNEIGK